MRESVLTSAFLVFALLVAAPASAGGHEYLCANGTFPDENADFGLAVINGGNRAYLYDVDDCSNPSRCKKVGAGHVMPGARVVTGRTEGNYVCIFFFSDWGSAGWVEKSRLRALAVNSKPARSSWLGRWSAGGNPSVRITNKRGMMHVGGEAYWPGPDPDPDLPPRHSGEIDGKLTLLGNRARYGDDNRARYDDYCRIDFTLVGDILIASDNSRCGGTNVRFSGVYRRVRA